MSKRKKALALIFLYIAFGFLVLTLFLMQKNSQLAAWKLKYENNHVHAFSDLVNPVDNLSTTMKKVEYATDSFWAAKNCGEIDAESEKAAMAIGVLPFSTV